MQTHWQTLPHQTLVRHVHEGIGSAERSRVQCLRFSASGASGSTHGIVRGPLGPRQHVNAQLCPGPTRSSEAQQPAQQPAPAISCWKPPPTPLGLPKLLQASLEQVGSGTPGKVRGPREVDVFQAAGGIFHGQGIHLDPGGSEEEPQPLARALRRPPTPLKGTRSHKKDQIFPIMRRRCEVPRPTRLHASLATSADKRRSERVCTAQTQCTCVTQACVSTVTC